MLCIKKSFTLAEIILTMTIVGSLASFTIPALIQNVQEAYFKVAFRVKYSQFSQAFTRMRIDNGGTLANVFISGDHDSFENQFRKYLNIINYSHTHRTDVNEDWYDYCNYKYLNGNTGDDLYKCSGCPSATFADGSFFMVLISWTNNDLTMCNRGGDYPREGLCFNVIFDVNGRKSPNTMGKDMYFVSVYRDKTVPGDWDLSGSVDPSTCTPTGTGTGCAIKYMMQ